MTSPVDTNEVFGIITIQYTYRFIGKSRNGDAEYDMTKLEDVKRAYINHSGYRSKSAMACGDTQLTDGQIAETMENTQPQVSDIQS